jgi:hypothetical protein
MLMLLDTPDCPLLCDQLEQRLISGEQLSRRLLEAVLQEAQKAASKRVLLSCLLQVFMARVCKRWGRFVQPLGEEYVADRARVASMPDGYGLKAGRNPRAVQFEKIS